MQNLDNTTWIFSRFDQLTLEQLYGLLKARQEVFTMEQKIHYQDLDELDKQAWHLLAWNEANQEADAYLRILPPGKKSTIQWAESLLCPSAGVKFERTDEAVSQCLVKSLEIYLFACPHKPI